MVIYIVKSLKDLAVEILTTKCKKDKYEELVDFDLMEKCCDGHLLQGCAASSQFICDCDLEHEYCIYCRDENFRLKTLLSNWNVFAKM